MGFGTVKTILEGDKPITLPPGRIAPPFLRDDGLTPADGERLNNDAITDAATAPSVTFINFPENIPESARNKLVGYQDSILGYRSWATLIWQNSVDKNGDLPKDSSAESKMRRTTYLARVGDYHMRMTPWLALKSDEAVSKHIHCKRSEFHTELIRAVLTGFVALSNPIYLALEAALESIGKTITVSRGEYHVSVVISERYEYEAISQRIRSFVLLTSYALSSEAYEIQTKKRTVEYMDVDISYTRYEAEFVHQDWEVAAGAIEEWKKKAMEDFVKDETIDLPF